MRVLVTNDDGIHSEGISVLADAARQLDNVEVIVVAPADEQSACSHSLTLRGDIVVDRLDGNRISVHGTPTDCVLLSLEEEIIGPVPDLVLSGINHGANMGDDVTYSGTVAAAMEATLYGIPSIAFSVAGRGDFLFETPARMIREIVERMLAEKMEPKTFWNVNFPNIPYTEVRGIHVTSLGKRFYNNAVIRQKDLGGREVYRIGGSEPIWEEEPGTDFSAVHDNCVSITPIHMDMNDYRLIANMRKWTWGCEGK